MFRECLEDMVGKMLTRLYREFDLHVKIVKNGLWFFDSVIQWFFASLIHWFIDSLNRWAIESIGSLLPRFSDSLVHCFVDSIFHWFSDSLSHWIIDEKLTIHWFILNLRIIEIDSLHLSLRNHNLASIFGKEVLFFIKSKNRKCIVVIVLEQKLRWMESKRCLECKTTF